MAEEAVDPNDLLLLLFKQTTEHALVLLDPAGKIVGWFAGAAQTFGYSAEEVLGKNVAILFTKENLSAGMDEYEQEVARSEMEAEDDRWMQRKDGIRFWASGVLSPIRDANGILRGFGKIVRDRTDMRAKTEMLEKRLAQLEKANQRKDQFIGTLAHELRSPLSSVSTALELLKLDSTNAETISFAAKTMGRELESMRRVVEDLLEATRASVGKVQLQTRRHDLREIVQAAIISCRPSIDERTQVVNVITAPAPLIVEVDEVRIRQVFVNLIQNAATFTRHGGTIWVKASLEANEAVVKVEDNGVGISPEILPHIFDLFTQAEFSGDRPGPGLGIGLSVVKDLTAMHGGSVQVRSNGLGKGSEFVVRLPLAPGEERPDSPG